MRGVLSGTGGVKSQSHDRRFGQTIDSPHSFVHLVMMAMVMVMGQTHKDGGASQLWVVDRHVHSVSTGIV